LLREHIQKEFKGFLDRELASFNEEEISATVEAKAEEIESKYFATYNPELPVFDFEIN
jgi:hypothetical protein